MTDWKLHTFYTVTNGKRVCRAYWDGRRLIELNKYILKDEEWTPIPDNAQTHK